MTQAVLYTDTDAIRSAVGVTTREVSDDLLTQQKLESQTKVSLYGWLPDHATRYAAGTATDATDQEVYVKDLIVLYCTYFGAVRVVEMIMALRRRVGDGKSEVERFDVNWLELLEILKGRLDEIQNLLEEELGLSSGGPSYFGKAVPDYDPVTNT
jgi:hypothetical protein